jgi:hypothetical protein
LIGDTLITTALRSSSVNTYDLCSLKGYIEYCLTFPAPNHKAASVGSLCHKVLECLALSKKCLQDGTTSFEDDLSGTIHINECEPKALFDRFKEYYSIEAPGSWGGYPEMVAKHTWTTTDFTNAWRWINMVLDHNNGQYDPRKNDIVAVEQFFDMEIPDEWARYEYQIGDKTLIGQLKIRGSIDLITKFDENTYVLRDYKTGGRYDFETRKTKGFHDFSEQFQFNFYYWVARQFYKDKTLLFDVIYTRDKYPCQLDIDDESAAEAYEYLKQTFLKIKSTQKPIRIKDIPGKDGPCKGFCPWNVVRDKATGKVMCDAIHERLQKEGADQVFYDIGSIEKLSKYSGGGKDLTL